MTDYDVAICGAGPVGLATALLLHRQGVPAGRIVVLDARDAEQAARDPRSIALSYGSRQILEQLRAWPAAADEIHQIHVSRRGHFGRTLIERGALGVPALGYVTRYGAVSSALNRAAEAAGIGIERPKKVSHLNEAGDAVTLRLDDGGELRAALVIHAEGGLFEQQQEKALRRDYGQNAVVAQVWASATIKQRAFERFTEEGPLALLPQDGGYALVWCVRPGTAADLLALDDQAFLEALGAAFGTRVGRFTKTTPRFSFSLGLNAEAAGTARTLAIGNAAQTLHPVAGQGLNLGLRDAAVLARCLRAGLTPEALAGFTARRGTDRKLTIRLTDTMARIFAGAPDGSLSQGLLGASLGVIDVLDPAKELLAEQMMYGWR